MVGYYHHANINTDNILHADTSAEFIRKYFENGEKELPLLLNPEYAAAFLKDYFLAARKERVLFFEFDRQYALPPERAIHTVSGFFLGSSASRESWPDSACTSLLSITRIFPYSPS